MKGLIIKDLQNLKTQSRILVILFIFVAIAVVNPSLRESFLSSIFSMLSLVIMITLFSIDELSNWNKFALTTCINRSDLVSSKYFLAIIFLIISLLVSLLLNLILGDVNFQQAFMISGLSISAFIIIISVIFPIFFKFGVQKGRMIMLIPIIGVYFLSQENNIIDNIDMIFRFLPLIAIALYILSMFISIKIINKKEFQ